MKEEIERVARNHVQEEKEKGRKVREIELLYYLSGWFRNHKLYLHDVLDVARKLVKEGLVEYS